MYDTIAIHPPYMGRSYSTAGPAPFFLRFPLHLRARANEMRGMNLQVRRTSIFHGDSIGTRRAGAGVGMRKLHRYTSRGICGKVGTCSLMGSGDSSKLPPNASGKLFPVSKRCKADEISTVYRPNSLSLLITFTYFRHTRYSLLITITRF